MWPFNKRDCNLVNNFDNSTNFNITKVENVELSENGILLFTHPNKLDDVAFERLRTQLSEVLKINLTKVIILENGMNLQCVLNNKVFEK